MARRTRTNKTKPSKMQPALSAQNTRTMNCSPIVEGKTVSKNTCFTNDALTKIKDAFNKNNGPDNQIAETEPRQLYEALRTRLVQCGSEDCWLEQIKDPKVRQQLDQILFAPDQPLEWKENPDEWLSNFDIEKVLQQYEIAHPEFKLLGPSSIDYDTKLPEEGGKCVWEDICRMDLKDLTARKKRKLGIVFNLDKHDEPGSHWVSMFVDLDKHLIFYYDSALNETPPEIVRLKDTIMQQGGQVHPPISFKYMTNKKAHQRTNTECGMYTIYFIISMLTGKRLKPKKSDGNQGGNHGDNQGGNGGVEKVFEGGHISDKEMMELRSLLFNPNP